MDTPTQNAGAGLPAEQAGMSTRTKVLLIVGALLIIASAVVYFGPRYGIDIGRFFAAEPSLLGPPVTNTVKLYPVFDQTASKVQFVLETGDYEITGFQFRAGISDAEFDMKGFSGSPVFQQELEAARVLADGALSYAAGVTAGNPGAISKTVIATINYALLPTFAATTTCVTVDMGNTIITARGHDTNVLDMNLTDWKNIACTTAAQPTPTAPTAIRGDVNADGKVDIQDFNIVVANFGRAPDSAVLGDENKDGKIDILDFNAVVTFFGTITPR